MGQNRSSNILELSHLHEKIQNRSLEMIRNENNFVRNGFMACETGTAIEKAIFRLVSVSEPFLEGNNPSRSVSGNRGFNHIECLIELPSKTKQISHACMRIHHGYYAIMSSHVIKMQLVLVHQASMAACRKDANEGDVIWQHTCLSI